MFERSTRSLQLGGQPPCCRCESSSSVRVPRVAHSIIGTIAVALEDPFKIFKESFGSFPFTPKPEIEYDRPVGPTVLPEVSLSVLSSAIVHLSADRRFIRLDIVTLQKFPPHCCYDRSQPGMFGASFQFLVAPQ